MSKERPKNVAASIRQRLLNLARERKEEFQLVLIHYALERLMYRLSRSAHKNEFVLKGAMLFQLWTGQSHRSTLDLDLLGTGDDSVPRFEAIFREVCDQTVEDDGLQFLANQIRGEAIREDQRYAGVRIHGLTMLVSARIPLQIDIGLGDAVTPRAKQVEYPSLLDLPMPVLRAYPKETVVAEKFEAMVTLGITNSRMKDFYDVWVLARDFEFDGAVLSRAIRATFERRKTPLPATRPLALTAEFSNDPAKQRQWRAFVQRSRLLLQAPPLTDVLRLLAEFLWSPTEAVAASEAFKLQWPVGGPWA